MLECETPPAHNTTNHTHARTFDDFQFRLGLKSYQLDMEDLRSRICLVLLLDLIYAHTHLRAFFPQHACFQLVALFLRHAQSEAFVQEIRHHLTFKDIEP